MPYLLKRATKTLEASSGERAMLAFLKDAPVLLVEAFSTGSNAQLVSAEFRFGNRYRADFCVLSGTSVGWHVHLIELEATTSRVFTKDGSDSKALNRARSQLQDWSHYIKTHLSDFRDELARDIWRRNIFQNRDNAPLRHSYCNEILDQRMGLRCHFHIVIGRRSSLHGEDIRRRSYYQDMHQCDVVTYDRFLELAEQHDLRLKEAQKRSRAGRPSSKQALVRTPEAVAVEGTSR